MEEIKEKFGEYADYVDVMAKYSFKNPTRSILKCSYGFNHHGMRDFDINGTDTTKCIRCGR